MDRVPFSSETSRMTIDTGPDTRHQPHPLPYPEGLQRGRYNWPYAGGLLFYHGMALFALLPWLFDWVSVAACLLGLYVFGTLGINLCYHRLLTHRSFACPRGLERLLALLGVCCLQDTPARWVAAHRLHHQHSDEQEDPHSPLAGFF
jgi:fatty-acid desaturase